MVDSLLLVVVLGTSNIPAYWPCDTNLYDDCSGSTLLLVVFSVIGYQLVVLLLDRLRQAFWAFKGIPPCTLLWWLSTGMQPVPLYSAITRTQCTPG